MADGAGRQPASSAGLPPLVLATGGGDAGGVLASAAAVAVAAAAEEGNGRPPGVVVAEVGAGSRRGPTMLASVGARGLERALRRAGFRAAARGSLCWLGLADGEDGLGQLESALAASEVAHLVIAVLTPQLWGPAIAGASPHPCGALLRFDLPADRSLAALAAIELRERGLVARIDRHGCGALAARRALAGLDPGGAAGRRARRLARAFLGNSTRELAFDARNTRAHTT